MANNVLTYIYSEPFRIVLRCNQVGRTEETIFKRHETIRLKSTAYITVAFARGRFPRDFAYLKALSQSTHSPSSLGETVHII